MQRCLQLAQQGAGQVSPNPMVGAVLVHEDLIIGEGYHEHFGEAHAEVNCISSVAEHHRHLIAKSTLYVSLEPCSHFGKTPPCADLIIKNKIPFVVIGSRDPFEKVNGSGIQKLIAAGIHVSTSVLEAESAWVNRRFFSLQLKRRPYIILKWAQSQDGMIAAGDNQRVKISSDITDRLVHKWRSEEAAIMVGTTTAMTDNPALTTRLWSGRNPMRIVVDANLTLDDSLHLMDGEARTIIFNTVKQMSDNNISYVLYDTTDDLPSKVCSVLAGMEISSLIVEGGSKLLQSFIRSGMWDEARIITNRFMRIGVGVPAPVMIGGIFMERQLLCSDEIAYFRNAST